METPFEKPAITTESQVTPVQRLIERRRGTEQALLSEGKLSFEAAKSNSGFLVDKPEVNVSDPKDIDKGILEMGREADRVVSDGLREEFEKHGLQPDGRTFYLIDFGLPHLPVLQSVLLDYGIDPSIYTSPSEETL